VDITIVAVRAAEPAGMKRIAAGATTLPITLAENASPQWQTTAPHVQPTSRLPC
jgi:hypothetical protein